MIMPQNKRASERIMGERLQETTKCDSPGTYSSIDQDPTPSSHWNGYPTKSITAIILLNLAVALPLAWDLNIWIDEAYSLNTTGGSFTRTLHQALGFELQPPLYFCLLNLWRTISGSVFFARLLSVLCVAATLLLCPSLSKQYLPSLHPGWLALCTALSPFVISCEIDIRLYAFALLESAVLLFTFHDGFLGSTPRRSSRNLHTAIAVLALYTQYYSGFLLLAFGITLLVHKQWRMCGAYILRMFVVGLFFIPLLPLLYKQFSAHQPAQTIPVSNRDILLFLPNRILGYLFPSDWMGDHSRIARLVTTVLFFGISLGAWRNLRSKVLHERSTIWPVFLTLSVVYGLLAVILNHDLLGKRHTVAFFLPSLLFLLWTLQLAGGRTAIRAGVITLLVLGMIPTLVLGYLPMAKAGDYRRAAEAIQQREKPGQPILLFTGEAALPIQWYYRSGLNPLVPLPTAEDFVSYDLSELVLHSEEQIIDILLGLPGQGEEFWLCTDYLNSKEPFLGIDFNSGILEKYLSTHYEVLFNQPLFHGRVRLLKKKPV
jgi:hypothetical protein